MRVVDLYDQARIAAEFGVSAGTVHASWRTGTLRALRARLVAAGRPDLAAAAQRMTRGQYDALRLGRLQLPPAALPLPDVLIGNRPHWRARTVRGWAAATGRVDDSGALRRASAPGRPAGIAERGPRRPARRAQG